ncbi:hypothetical protein KC343_g226 [Hortaea werneckii]|uniref:DNA replication regulator Sld3 C-terminal domain-containing protein n=1 Tax=Hortaea werneckii TaxID=91943 RepID=A0A3M7GQ30_HORWE|nr:hypothetical protein KC338_g5212 [Hortaea werneckii]KAI7291694.1 hypothetical protein KC352_g2584 [Hortaea werneckii]KAI7572922.1 hypothetical protein KC317_g331 [Hortaea werneckii]KAI7628313.1 hypothetical protein KC346_g244 [Hortaea werneckii]KAI7638201.1 hypothetical protein KC343_g226 [Hortaea werneckii]
MSLDFNNVKRSKEEHQDSIVEATRKRKRQTPGNETIDLDRRPFAIRPDASEPFGAPVTFTPLTLLPRAHLPLSYLDPAQNSSRLFSAHINALEQDHELGNSSVLIAEESKEKRFYAIERAKWRTYVLCRLNSWVKLEVLARTASAADNTGQNAKRRETEIGDGQPWWARAAVSLPEAPHRNVAHGLRVRLDMQPMDAKVKQEESDTKGTPDGGPPIPENRLSEIQPAEPTHSPMTATTATDVLQDLTKHYLDALYLSRTSLAYFTKGPLSRARAAFTTPQDSSSDLRPTELVAFLRDTVLSMNVMDKKYRDTLPAQIQDLPALDVGSPDHAQKTQKKRKAKKWKAKRDKLGLFSDEKEYVEKWWREQDESIHSSAPSSGETTEAGLKRRLPRLRSRETYLQLTLALEVLALEASIPASEQQPQDSAVGSPNAEARGADSQDGTATKKVKAKKTTDLPALLDTLVDRLSIWHSLDGLSPAKKSTEGEASTGVPENGTNDELRDFCIEVIIPFYISRIPQHAVAVNKKLGGPSAPTPVKRKSASSRKPGEPASRQHHQQQAPDKKPRNPLSRVASEARGASNQRSSSSHGVPSLSRSATDSDVLLTHIKRENSQTPTPELSSIPAANVPAPRKRSGLAHSYSQSNIAGGGRTREFDPSALNRTNEAKAKKKAEMESKLQEAISALRKPNRSLATKEVAENADLSFAKATARPGTARPGLGGRKKTGERGVLGGSADAVVMATPSQKRATVQDSPARYPSGGHSSGTTHVLASAVRPRQEVSSTSRLGDELPRSSFAVPATGHRVRTVDFGSPRGHGVSNKTAGVADTPSRGFAKFMPRGLVREPGTLDSPVAATQQVAESPTTSRRHHPSASALPSADAVGGDSPLTARMMAPPSRKSHPVTPMKPLRSLSLVPQAAAEESLVQASPNVSREERNPQDRQGQGSGDGDGGQSQGRKRAGGNIYNALGWDDEYEELT